jgi:hypothetical protein
MKLHLFCIVASLASFAIATSTFTTPPPTTFSVTSQINHAADNATGNTTENGNLTLVEHKGGGKGGFGKGGKGGGGGAGSTLGVPFLAIPVMAALVISGGAVLGY